MTRDNNNKVTFDVLDRWLQGVVTALLIAGVIGAVATYREVGELRAEVRSLAARVESIAPHYTAAQNGR